MSISSSQVATNIRLATVEDVDGLILFARKSFSHTFGHLYPVSDLQSFLDSSYTAEIFSSWIVQNASDDSPFHIWLATSSTELEDSSSNSIQGYILAGPCSLPHDSVTSSCGEIHKCYVDPSQFGKGLAAQLMQAAISWLRIKDANRKIWLGCYSENFRAQKFYSRFGFQKIGEYKYIVGDSEDLEFIYMM